MSLTTVITGPVLIAGSISRLIKRIGVIDPTSEATDTARIIPEPTTSPSKGSVFNKTSADRLISEPHRIQKIVPFKTPTSISFLRK